MFKIIIYGKNIIEVSFLRNKKKKSYKKKVLVTFIILITIYLLGFYLYVTYNNIEIDDKKYETSKVQSTIQEQTVENVEEESKKIADMIEETTRKVVGISKLKNAGSSIFSKSTESELRIRNRSYYN